MSPLGMPCSLHCTSGLSKPNFLQNIKYRHIVVGQGMDSQEKGTEETMCKMDIKKILCYMILNLFSIDTLRKPV